MTQTTVGIRELKAQLSAYVQRVKAGDTVVITEHGKAVGRIVPIEPSQPSVEERLQAMIREGIVEWDGRKLKPRTPVTEARDLARSLTSSWKNANDLIPGRQCIGEALCGRARHRSGERDCEPGRSDGHGYYLSGRSSCGLRQSDPHRNTDANRRAAALQEFRDEWPQLIRLQVTERLVAHADSLAWSHSLRGSDAVRLAAAMAWQDAFGMPVTLATFDRLLWKAANRTGILVYPADLPVLLEEWQRSHAAGRTLTPFKCDPRAYLEIHPEGQAVKVRFLEDCLYVLPGRVLRCMSAHRLSD